MPIAVSRPLRSIPQDAFHAIDRVVRGLAFTIHNELGKYLDEQIYQRELGRRCAASGLDVAVEFPVTVSYHGFEKTYFVDLLVNQAVVIETKTATTLTPLHIAQTLNYLFLCDLHFASLLNFRTDRVQHQFVSTQLDLVSRRRFELDVSQWKPMTATCEQLFTWMTEMLYDWGAFLDPILYRDGLTHLLGGVERVERSVPLRSGCIDIGSQKVHLVTDDVAFSVTASTHHPESVLKHQQRFLKHTPLKAIQWINLNHHTVIFRTITR